MADCWLCLYNHTDDARTLTAFIHENIPSSSPESIAAQVSAELVLKHPNAKGTSPEACRCHIESHTLHPTCRIGTMLRSLLQLSDEIHRSMRTLDEDGRPAFDLKLTKAYLETQAQIMSIYRTGEQQKLMFSS